MLLQLENLTKKVTYYTKILIPFYLLGSENAKAYLNDILLDFTNNIPKQTIKDQFGKTMSMALIEHYRY